MSYRRYRKKTGLRTASLATLEEQIAATEARIKSRDPSIQEAQSIEEQLLRLQRRIAETTARRSALRSVRRPKSGLLAGMFGLTEQPAEVSAEIASLETAEADLLMQKSALEIELSRVSYNRSAVDHEKEWLAKLKEAVARKRKKKDSMIELRAAAAANADQTRRLGSTVRRVLTLQTYCPYCGGPLGEAPHADHIYPVSRGGRSVPKNMVFTCSKCNGLKRDLTLAIFVRKFHLDRAAIERRLEELGKEF